MVEVLERPTTDAFSTLTPPVGSSGRSTTSQPESLVELYVEAARMKSAWYRFQRQIRQISMLPADWNSYGARPVSIQAINEAIRAVSYLSASHMPIPDAVPLPSGGVQLEWRDSVFDIEIRVDSNGFCHVSVEHIPTDTIESFDGLREVGLYQLIKHLNLKSAA